MSGHLEQIRLDSYKPLRELVCEHIREAIINGVFAPGERLMEIQMADEMGVSRTPVREAIRKLEMEGFVVMIPRRGTYVSNMSIKDINDVYEIRISLDTLAAGLAAERISDEELEELQRLLVKVGNAIEENDMAKVVEADIEFHDVLYKASRNERLRNIINNLREQITVIRGVSMRYPGRLKDTQEEHRRLVESIAARDVEKSQEAARIHNIMNIEMTKPEETLDSRRLFKYDLIILAGGAGAVTLPEQGERARSLAELKGRRLLDYIVDGVRESSRVASVVLVTHSAHLEAFRQADVPDLLLCACDGSMAECAAAAIRKLQEQPGHENITKVATVCDDLPFLTGEALDDFIARAEAAEADGVYAIVRKEACLREFPSLRRTFFHLKEGDFTGGNVSLVSVDLFPGCIEKMKEVFALRKNPVKLAAWLGARTR